MPAPFIQVPRTSGRNIATTESLVNFTVKIGAPKNIALLPLDDRKFFLWIAPHIIQKLKRQMVQGRMPSGASLPPYTDAYKAKKQKHGKWRGHPDLTWSGAVVRSLKAQFKKKGSVKFHFAGLHPKAVMSGGMTPTQIAQIEKRKASGKPLTKKQAMMERLHEMGKRRLTNQNVADILGVRFGTGDFRPGFGGKPPYEFMNLSQAEFDWTVRMYERKVVSEQMKGLPAAISMADIPAEYHKWVTVKPSPK